MTAGTQRIRVVLADDHRLFREGVASLIERAPDIELVGEAATGEDALRLMAELQPDIVLSDCRCLGQAGLRPPPLLWRRIQR